MKLNFRKNYTVIRIGKRKRVNEEKELQHRYGVLPKRKFGIAFRVVKVEVVSAAADSIAVQQGIEIEYL